jgi:hypothetical protein
MDSHYYCQSQSTAAWLRQRQHNSEDWAIRTACDIYERAVRQGWLERMICLLRRRPRCLWDLGDVANNCVVRARFYAGQRTVPIRQIRGSEGRCQDFDAGFYPRQMHSRTRWVGLATARLMGVAMPPVQLIQIADVYFVLDGHHRISVACALGEQEIDALVTIWQVAGPVPWQRAITSRPTPIFAGR